MKLAWICSAGLRWSYNIYLQANQSTAAADFYKRIGFHKLKNNNVSELPSSWRNANKDSMYIKFVDGKTNKKEAQEHSTWDNLVYSKESFLHLYWALGKVGWQELKESAAVVYSTQYNAFFLDFPFQTLGHWLDGATDKLSFFGHPLFLFFDPHFFFLNLKTLLNMPSKKSY